MTIRRRLILSYFVVLLLLGFNLFIYFWGNQRRQSTVDALRRAMARQSLTAAIDQDLKDIQKQVTLLSQVATESPESSIDPEEIARFNRQLEIVEIRIAAIQDLSEAEARDSVVSFAEKYRDLATSWRTFFENSGVNQTKAITELAVRAEPLARDLLGERLPQLQQQEEERVAFANADYNRVAELTDRTTILIFAVTVLVAVGVAIGVSRQLARGLVRLKQGAAAIGAGDLAQRIRLQGNDELADLARSFNEMTADLAKARDQLTLLNQQERDKSDLLVGALDELRKAQDQLVAQQKLASLGSLTAGIAHEIRNPLNFVTNFAEVALGMMQDLKEEPAASVETREILDSLEQSISKIQQHGRRADGIVRGMLLHSQGLAGERRLTNINGLVSEYVKLAYLGLRAQDSDFNVDIIENYAASLEPIIVIPQDLSRVFLNLAHNACYAAHAKAKSTGDSFSPVVSVSTMDRGDAIEIRIRDNGDGISETSKKRLFEPFFTTKPPGSGTGLGLWMSHEIVVQHHGGEIRAESEPGQYAEFIVTLPKKP